MPPKTGGSRPMEEREHPEIEKAEQRYTTRTQILNKRISLFAVGACILVVIIALIILGLSRIGRADRDDGLILSNVYVAGVNLGGMDKDEAESALRLTLGDSFSTQDMVVTLPDAQLVLSPADTEAFVNIEDLVDAAYQYGRTGSRAEMRKIRANAENRKYVIALLDYMYLDLEYIRDAVNTFCNNYTSVMVQTSVTLNGNRPDYKSIIADGIPISSVKHQTLVIRIGTPQLALDPEVLYREILDAYSLFILSFTYDAPIAVEPDLPDAQALFNKYCNLPEDATMDSNTFQVTPEIYGYGFDVAEVARRIHRAEFGDTITITLGFLYPEITEEDLSVNYFQDILSTYISTNQTYDYNRNVNLQQACAAINGLIIKAGESFNFNQVVGPRTANTGYLSAPTYHGSSTNTIGGGISQVASVLRYCAMIAGLRVDEYHLHDYAVPYTPFGTDAAINYGTENLVFTNTTSDPIQIFASVLDGTVIISLMGTEERDYVNVFEYEVLQVLDPEVEYQYMTEDNVYGYTDGHELQSGLTGYITQLYISRRDAVTGEEISRELLGVHVYSRRNQILVRLENSEDAMDPSAYG